MTGAFESKTINKPVIESCCIMKVIDNWGFVWSILAYMSYVYQRSYRDLFVIKS